MRFESMMARSLGVASLVLSCGLLAVPAMAAEGINRDADEILQAMSKFLAGTKTLSVSVDASLEVVTKQGQKLQLLNSATVLLERPSRFYMARKGRFADTEAYFDGKRLSFYGKAANVYVQRDVAGQIDDALNALEMDIGIPIPAGDLMLSNPYPVLTAGLVSSGYYGVAYVAGVASHHLAFRKAGVDWQLWVKAEGDPLPIKYVITTLGMDGAPQYSVQFTNWNLKPAIAAKRFDFVVPKDARKLAALPLDETGEVAFKPEGK